MKLKGSIPSLDPCPVELMPTLTWAFGVELHVGSQQVGSQLMQVLDTIFF